MERGGKRVFLLFCWFCCGAQVIREEADDPPDRDRGAFFALRSCHQLLGGAAGHFFSPDYLCSNPPLWCNWTIQADPGKRVHLHLEDLTPDDTCHLKQDQVHVDDPAGPLRGHRILQKCWREVRYTSSSSTLHVVLLVGGWPSPPYRGFHGHYRAFGPPVVYAPQEGLQDGNGESDPLRLMGSAVNGGMEVLKRPLPESSELMFDYYDPPSSQEEEEEEETEEDDLLRPVPTSHASPSTVPAATSRSARGASEAPPPDPSAPGADPLQELRDRPRASTRTPTAIRRNVEEGDESGTQNPTEEQRSEGLGPIPEGTGQTPPQPNMVAPRSDHRGNLGMRNRSDGPHLPGDQLLEAAVEVTFGPDQGESWETWSTSLMLSVETLVGEQLKALDSPVSTTSKRMKRLRSGALHILWLQIGQRPGGLRVQRDVRSALDGLVAMEISIKGSDRRAVVSSVSTADVDECGTQLVLCDVNADCVNRFGSYSCRCRPGFRDASRLGSGGTACVAGAAGCSSRLSAEARGVYALFFLLSSLILTLLAAAAVLYHRHHRGAFLVRCHSSSSCHHDDGYSGPADSELPPPPPPAQDLREDWPKRKERRPALDPPLLRFSPLPPPGGRLEPQEAGKM